MKLLTYMVILLVAVAYIVIGGVVFHFLEEQNESDTRIRADAFFLEFMRNNTCVSREEIVTLLRSTFAAYQTGQLVNNETAPTSWDYYSSIFFSMTVVTTIGYGNISPSTVPGRIFCVVFAIIGIPLFLVAAAGMGERLLLIIRHSQKCCFKPGPDGERSRRSKICGGVFFVIIGIGLFIIVPGVVFMFLEGWSLAEGLYYAIITLTTVGFGDYVAGSAESTQYTGFRSIYRLCVAGWIFVGLSWMAGIISAIQDVYSKRIQQKEDAAATRSQASRHSGKSDRRSMPGDRLNRDSSQRDLHRVYSVENGGGYTNGNVYSPESAVIVSANGEECLTKL